MWRVLDARQAGDDRSTHLKEHVYHGGYGVRGGCHCPQPTEEALVAEAPETPAEPDAPAETEEESHDQTAAGRQPQQLSGEGAQDRGDGEAEAESA